MESEGITVKIIVRAIEEYYDGKQIEEVCRELEIEHEVFIAWLKEYKGVALELMELKIENGRLRKMLIDVILENQFQSNRLNVIKKLRKGSNL